LRKWIGSYVTSFHLSLYLVKMMFRNVYSKNYRIANIYQIISVVKFLCVTIFILHFYNSLLWTPLCAIIYAICMGLQRGRIIEGPHSVPSSISWGNFIYPIELLLFNYFLLKLVESQKNILDSLFWGAWYELTIIFQVLKLGIHLEAILGSHELRLYIVHDLYYSGQI